MQRIIVLLFLLSGLSVLAQSPNVQWLKEQNYFAGEAFSIAEDAEGFIYVAGNFSEELDFDPTASELILSPTGQSSSYIAKYDSVGNFITATVIKANASIATSAPNTIVSVSKVMVLSDGSVIVGGLFRGALSIAGNDDLIDSNPNYDGFMAKLDSDLNYQWYRRISSATGPGVDGVTDFDISSNDEIYVLASVQTGTVNTGLQINSTAYFETSSMTHSVISFDADGILINACFFFSGVMRKLALDEEDNVYIAFTSGASNTDFNGESILGEATATLSALSLDADLSNVRWVKRLGGSFLSQATGMVCKHSALYVYGRSDGIIDSEVFNGRQLYLTKLEDETGDFIWTKQFGMVSSDAEISVSMAEYGDLLVVCGTYSDLLTLDETNLVSNGGTDNFLLAYDSLGALSFIHSLGSSSTDNRMILSTQGESLVLTGFFGPSTNFDLNGGNENLGAGFKNILAKYSGFGASIDPFVNLGADTVICAGQVYFLQSGISTSDYNHLWSTGSTSSSIGIAESGAYYLDIFDLDNNFIDSDTINIEVESIDFSLGDDVEIMAESYDIIASLPGTYFWNTGAQGPSITVTQSGTYDVSYIAPSGCIYTDEITVTLLPIAINDHYLNKLEVQPNPFTSQIQVKGDFKNISFQLMDIKGRTLMSGNINANEALSLDNIENGSYFLNLLSEDGRVRTFPLIKAE